MSITITVFIVAFVLAIIGNSLMEHLTQRKQEQLLERAHPADNMRRHPDGIRYAVPSDLTDNEAYDRIGNILDEYQRYIYIANAIYIAVWVVLTVIGVLMIWEDINATT